MHKEYMKKAVELSRCGVEFGKGGPFGAVVVKNGRIIASERNRVVPYKDPTAHAEVMAIRKAAAVLNTHDLSGCVLYTSCEPCPMCMGAIYWANIKEVHYAANRYDADLAGFRDAFIYDEVDTHPLDRIHVVFHKAEEELAEAAKAVLEEWHNKQDKVSY